jgi:hypothetical protein
MQVPIGMGGIEDGRRRCASPGWGFVPPKGGVPLGVRGFFSHALGGAVS